MDKICGLLDYNNYVMWKTKWKVVDSDLGCRFNMIIYIDTNNTDGGGAAFVSKMFDFSLPLNLIHPRVQILQLQREPAEGSMKPHMGRKPTCAARSRFLRAVK